MRADPFFIRHDDYVAELYALADSIVGGDSHSDGIAKRYAIFYERVERVIVRLLKFKEIEVEPRRADHLHHNYHESILEMLAEKNNPFHSTLGTDCVQRSLFHAKIFRNRYRRCGANDLYKASYIPCNTKTIARALRETNDHLRSTIAEDRLESALEHLLQMRADKNGNQDQGSKLEPQTRFKARELGLDRASQALNDILILLKLDPKEYNSPDMLKRVLLEPSDSHLAILQETLKDISIMFKEVHTNGQKQAGLLTRFVATGLDERRKRDKTDLHERMGELTAQVVDLLSARIERITELETRTRLLRTGAARFQARLSLKTAEAAERLKQSNVLKQVIKDVNTRLQQAISDHIEDLSRCGELQDQNARLRSQLEAERKSYEACKIRTVAIEEKNKSHKESCLQDAYQKLETERDSHKATKKYVGCVVDGHALLTTQVSTMQEEMRNLRAELAAERSFREAAEGKARRFQDEVDSIRAGMETMLRRPGPNRS